MINKTPAGVSVGLVALVALLGGCSFVPKYERPAAPIASAWPGGVAPVAGQTAAADIAWQDYFVDARLKRLLEIALANNRDLRVAALNIERSQAQYRIQRASQYPSINGVFAGQRQAATQDVYTLGASITSFEIDFFGRVASLKDAALAQYLSTDESRKTVQISLISAVASTYLSMLADESKDLGLSRCILDSFRETSGAVCVE